MQVGRCAAVIMSNKRVLQHVGVRGVYNNYLLKQRDPCQQHGSISAWHWQQKGVFTGCCIMLIAH